MTARPTPATPLDLLAAQSPVWAASLDLLRAEMAALTHLMPGNAPQDAAGAEAREARLAEAFETDFDDIPV